MANPSRDAWKRIEVAPKVRPGICCASIGYADRVVDDEFFTEDDPRYQFPGVRTVEK